MRIATVLVIILFASIITPTMVFAHYPHIEDECPSTEQLGSREKCLLEQRESGKEVKFVDVFFSEGAKNVGGNTVNAIPTKIEVAPGDGTTILVAVMANSGPFELTGLKGWLSLPVGFQAAGRSAGEPAFDTYDLGIPPGSVFVFEFPVDVKENTRVGMYKAILHIEFFKARDIGLNFRDFEVEFLLTGKSVLDARAVTPVLLPSTNNNAKIEIVNDGTAAASGVIASIDLKPFQLERDVNQIVNLGAKVFDIGVIKPQSKVVIDPKLYVNPALADKRQNVIVDLMYFDAYGQRRTTSIPVNFLVAGTATESIDFMLTTDKSVIRTTTETPITLTLYNTGTETARSVEVTVTTPIAETFGFEGVPQASESPLIIVRSDGYIRIESIKPGESANASITLLASEDALNTGYSLPVTISYLDQSGGVRQIERNISVYVQGTINLRVYDLGITYIGDEPNLSGYILNEGTALALFTTVELVKDQGFMQPVSGPQYLGDLTANSPLPFNIPIKLKHEISSGIYPVTLMISYKDDLRVPFGVSIDGNVNYQPIMQVESDGSANYALIATGIGIATAGIGWYFYKKKIKLPLWVKRKPEEVAEDDDIDFLTEEKK